MSKRKKKQQTAGIISLGCSKNLVDTEFIMGGLADEGYAFSPLFDDAELLVVNTCGFLQSSVEESTEAIEEALAWKKKRGGGTVVVAGCLVNRQRDELAGRFPGVDIFLPPGAIGELPALLAGAGGRRPEGSCSYLPPAGAGRVLTADSWAYLKISDGCDNRCSYCLIPRLRGEHRGRSSEAVVEEVLSLVEAGVREINVVGQDITRWKGERGDEDLKGLVSDLSSLPGEFRLRLLYLHPSRIDRELAEIIASSEKVFPYLDLPIQHANDRVLASMNRPYGRSRLEGLWTMLRETVPEAALRTTVMLGFPGEGEEEFADLLDFLGKHPFENLGAFVYSPEEGTAAVSLEGQVDPSTARERYDEVLTLQQDLSERLWRKRVGRVTEAIVLAGVEDDADMRWGRTAWQAPEVDGGILMKGAAEPGEIVKVKITAAGPYDLEGDILDA